MASPLSFCPRDILRRNEDVEMSLDPQWIIAGCAVVTLAVLLGSTLVGIAIWLEKRLRGIEQRLMRHVDEKHKENQLRYDALAVLVMRHDTILDPEFNGSGLPKYARRP